MIRKINNYRMDTKHAHAGPVSTLSSLSLLYVSRRSRTPAPAFDLHVELRNHRERPYRYLPLSHPTPSLAGLVARSLILGVFSTQRSVNQYYIHNIPAFMVKMARKAENNNHAV